MPPANASGRATDADSVITEAGTGAPVAVARRSTYVRAGLRPLGAVAYDLQTLPLVSPDGLHVATQGDLAPPQATLLANFDAAPPATSTIEVYRLDHGATPRPPSLVASLQESAVLGRSANAQGFLIESPRDDASRWVGLASWTSGTINWLINDDKVNAFAVLGPDGRMAWCRREIDGQNFELVIRAGSRDVVISSPGEDWLMPTFSATGQALYAYSLKQGALHLNYFALRGNSNITRPSQRLFLANNATVDTAYQSAIGQSTSVEAAAQRGGLEQHLFFHPAQMRMAVWRPLDSTRRAAHLLAANSFSAIMDEPHYALMGTQQAMFRQNVTNAASKLELLRGTWIPRATLSPRVPYILLGVDPGRPDEIVLMGMALIPVTEELP